MMLALAFCLVVGADEIPKGLKEFLVDRDRWLAVSAMEELPDVKIKAAVPPDETAVRVQAETLVGLIEQRDSIRKRIEKNKTNPSLSALVKKDVEREKKASEDIKAAETKLQSLRDASRERRDRMVEQHADDVRRKAERDKTAFVKGRELAKASRNRLDLMPPNTPTLDPSNLAVGVFGFLPQWPTGVRLDPIQKQAVLSAAARIRAGTEMQQDFRLLDRDTPGGTAAAKKLANLKILQVVDDKRLFVTLIGDREWPTFAIDVDSTKNMSDGSLVRANLLLVAIKTYTYRAVDGSNRTVFVFRAIKESDLPPYREP